MGTSGSYQAEEGDYPWERRFILNMRWLREHIQQMTQTDLAKVLKDKGLPFHQPTIQRIENGERPVRLNEAFMIAEALNTNLSAMLKESISAEMEALDVAILSLRRDLEMATMAARKAEVEKHRLIDRLDRLTVQRNELVVKESTRESRADGER